jgi:hypothetical protein
MAEPSQSQRYPESAKVDLLAHLSTSLQNSLVDTSVRISEGEAATRSFHLGLSRLQLYEIQSMVSDLFSAAAQDITDTLKVVLNRQGRLVEGVGLLGVATSLVTGGCVFCGEQSQKRKHLEGDELFAHIEKHFNADSGAEAITNRPRAWTGDELMAIKFPSE